MFGRIFGRGKDDPEQTVCAKCGRTLLAGEWTRKVAGANGEKRLICSLCAPDRPFADGEPPSVSPTPANSVRVREPRGEAPTSGTDADALQKAVDVKDAEIERLQAHLASAQVEREELAVQLARVRAEDIEQSALAAADRSVPVEPLVLQGTPVADERASAALSAETPIRDASEPGERTWGETPAEFAAELTALREASEGPPTADAVAAAPAEIQPEAQPEAPAEVPPEAQHEAPAEVQPEAPAEVQPEAPAEVPPEAQPEAPAEVQPEAPAEVQPEAPAEVQPEAPAEFAAELAALRQASEEFPAADAVAAAPSDAHPQAPPFASEDTQPIPVLSEEDLLHAVSASPEQAPSTIGELPLEPDTAPAPPLEAATVAPELPDAESEAEAASITLLQRGVDLLNVSSVPRKIAETNEQLGLPSVRVDLEGQIVALTFMWSMGWYRFHVEVDTGDVRMVDRGYEELADVQPNVAARADGTVQLAPALISRAAVQRSQPADHDESPASPEVGRRPAEPEPPSIAAQKAPEILSKSLLGQRSDDETSSWEKTKARDFDWNH